MGLVWRNGHCYYYESKRRDGRVITRYVCSGDRANKLAQFKATLREQLKDVKNIVRRAEISWRQKGESERVARRQERSIRVTAEEALGYFADLVDCVVRIAMFASGHCPHHGEWRMSRYINTQPQLDEAIACLDRAIQPAFKGDRAALKTLRAFLNDLDAALPPAAKKLVLNRVSEQVGADPARAALDALLSYHCGQNLVKREYLERRLVALREELAPKDASPLQQLVVDRYVFSWLDAWMADQQFYIFLAQENRPIPTAQFLLRAREKASKQLERAGRSLCLVQQRVLPKLTSGTANVSEGQPTAVRFPLIVDSEEVGKRKKGSVPLRVTNGRSRRAVG